MTGKNKRITIIGAGWAHHSFLHLSRVNLESVDVAPVEFHALSRWNSSSDRWISLWAATNPFLMITSSRCVVVIWEMPRSGRNLASKASVNLWQVANDCINFLAFRTIYIQWVSLPWSICIVKKMISLKGCFSDIPIVFYSLSTDLRNWKETHGSQKDIYEYWISLAKKYRLYDHIIFNRKVISATWDDIDQEYDIVTEDTVTGERSRTTAHILISAIGVLETPRLPSIPGLENFKGEMFHSARWNPDVDLRGKRVGVVGNAASAWVSPVPGVLWLFQNILLCCSTQFVPCIAEDPTVQIIQFCRTPKWIFAPVRGYILTWYHMITGICTGPGNLLAT